jgi:MFS superfamily sulfate permease-like transporter
MVPIIHNLLMFFDKFICTAITTFLLIVIILLILLVWRRMLQVLVVEDLRVRRIDLEVLILLTFNLLVHLKFEKVLEI